MRWEALPHTSMAPFEPQPAHLEMEVILGLDSLGHSPLLCQGPLAKHRFGGRTICETFDLCAGPTTFTRPEKSSRTP